jgi:CheY-like chemotaxis protein
VQRAADAGANIGLLKSSCTPNKLIGVINNVLAGDDFDTKHMSLLAAPLRDKRDTPNTLAMQPPTEMQKSAPTLLDETEERKPGMATEMRHAFTFTEARSVTEMRALWQSVLLHDGAGAQKMAMTQIWTKLRGISASATAAGCTFIARFTSALEALLRDLNDEPNNVNYSRMLTVAEGIDFIKYLFDVTGGMNFGSPNPSTVLLIDPDIEFAFSMERAFANVNLRLVQATDSGTGQLMLDREAYDLILLETDLPDASGYNFSLQIRGTTLHSKTPIMFFGANVDADSRPRAVLCGGKEIFAKPLLVSEVVVKALMQVMRDEVEASQPS